MKDSKSKVNNNLIKGFVISTAAVVVGVASFLIAWNAALTKYGVDLYAQQAATAQWQKIYGERIDWLVQRSGANPEAITRFKPISNGN